MSSGGAVLNKTMSEIGTGPSVSLEKQSGGKTAVIMDKIAGESLESKDSEGKVLWERLEISARSSVVKEMKVIFGKAAAKGWELPDNNAGTFMWDVLTRIDFDEAHVERRKEGVTAEMNRCNG